MTTMIPETKPIETVTKSLIPETKLQIKTQSEQIKDE
jgi:hypothetical protein